MLGIVATGTSRHTTPATSMTSDANGPVRVLRTRGRSLHHAASRPAVHRDRHSVSTRRLGRDLQSPDGLHEIDRYDGADTLYLIVYQPGTGRHLGSVRLLPSMQPHMLRDMFPHLCDDGVPAAYDTWEITRLVTSATLPPSEALQVRRQLAIALLEHAIASDIARYTLVTHMPWLAALLAIGWDAEPLGMPCGADETAMAAMQILVDAETLARLRSDWGLPNALLAPGKDAGVSPKNLVLEIDRERVRAL